MARDRATAYAKAVVAGREVAGPFVRLAAQRHLQDIADGRARGLRWSVAEAQHGIDFFEEVLHLPEVEPGAPPTPFLLHPSQDFIVGSLFGWLTIDDVRRFRVAYIEQGKGNGKALALDTPIATPSGWTTMGALQVGDQVFDERGRPTRVVSATDVLVGRACYALRCQGPGLPAEQILADAAHQWPASCGGAAAVTATTEQLRAWASTGTPVMIGGHRLVTIRAVPSVPVRCIEVDAPSHLFLAGRTLVPTHNSPLAAGIGLKCFVADGEASPEVYTAATMREQARICWNDAKVMVEASPWLLDRHIKVTANALLAPASAGIFKPVSSEARGLEGKRVHCAILDEIHEHPNGDVVSKMRAGTKGRPQPLIVEITNSGFDRTSVCWEHHEYSSKILRGVIQADHWFAFICGLDEGDDWHDPKVWKKANPLLGTGVTTSLEERMRKPALRTTISPKYLQERISEADGIPSEEAKVQRLNFCIWTRGKVQWMPFEIWQACDTLVPDDELRHLPCFGGIDLGQSDDFSAAVLVWPRPTDWVVRAWFWIPEAVKETKAERPYVDWEQRGELIVHPGEVTDIDRLEDDLVTLWQPYQVQEVGYDRRHASQLALRLANEHEYAMVDTPQGFFLSEAITELERRLKTATLLHGGNATLGWMFDNVVLRTNRDGLKKIDRGVVKEKVDGIVALANATDRIIRQGATEAKSVLETRGPREL